MYTLRACCMFLIPALCSAENFQFNARGHTYTVTMTAEATAGLTFDGHWLYEVSPIWPSSLTSNEYVLLFASNTNAYPSGWPVPESIFMQTSSNGLNWGSPSVILSKASNICDMIDARPIYDIANSVWRVFVQAVEYSGSSCGTDAQLFEAVGSTLTSLSWYGSGGNATSITGDLGDPGLGEGLQLFNTKNYDGPSSTPILFIYNDWNFTDPNSSYCPTCTANGTPMFAYLTANAETGYDFWYYTSPSYNSQTGLLYLDVLLGGTDNQSTLGPPGFTFGPQYLGYCTGSNPGTQYGVGIGFYPTPVPNNTNSPSLPGQYESGTFPSSDSGLITYIRAARNPYGFLDLAGTSPNTWHTFLYYNISSETSGVACPEPTIQATYENHGGSGNPYSAIGATYVTITEQ